MIVSSRSLGCRAIAAIIVRCRLFRRRGMVEFRLAKVKARGPAALRGQPASGRAAPLL
jgi:hypothetical protein